MNKLIAALCFALAMAPAMAQDKAKAEEKKRKLNDSEDFFESSVSKTISTFDSETSISLSKLYLT